VYDAVRQGGWTAVGTANGLSCSAHAADDSFARFEVLVEEVALMHADLSKRGDDVVRIQSAADIGRHRRSSVPNKKSL
jgi:hypothetical protein